MRARALDAGVRVVSTYGMSETCGGCVYDGRPLDGVAVKIGADARVRIGGPVVFTGYDGQPELTAAAKEGDWFVTQDLGRIDHDGLLEVAGRVDDVVISGGVNVPAPAVAACWNRRRASVPNHAAVATRRKTRDLPRSSTSCRSSTDDRPGSAKTASAARSRHARPAETEIIEPVPARPRRSRPPVEPGAEPRRRPSSTEDTRDRRNVPPVERRSERDRTERAARRDRTERPVRAHSCPTTSPA